jgi:hypothetical protein
VNNTFTVTTGHQLNLFTGPLYFLYKIISTINLTKELKAKYPAYNLSLFIGWRPKIMILKKLIILISKEKFRWNKESTGPVGRLSTQGLSDVFELYSQELGQVMNAETLKNLFKDAYLNHDNLADATRHLRIHFGAQGLVILMPMIPI